MRYFDRARFKTFFKCVTGWHHKLLLLRGKTEPRILTNNGNINVLNART